MVSLPLRRRSSPSPPSSPKPPKEKKPKPPKDIPSSFRSSLRVHRAVGSHEEAEKAQEALLRRLPYFRLPGEPDPESGLVARQYQLPLASGEFINALEIKAVPAPGELELAEGPANILLHGYALGLGFFWRNWDEFGKMSAQTGRRAFILDWMGLGLSSRPHPKHFSLKQKHDSDAARAAHAEAFFLDPLLEFFDLKKITTANLVAHSLGGYLALAFALKEPTRVENLILLSPAGIPVYPFGEAGEKADKGKGKEEQEAKVEDAVEMETGFGVGSASGSGSGSASGTEDDEEDEELKTGDKKPQAFKGPTGDSGKLMKSLYSWMWETNKSPLQVVRSMGPFGQLLLGKYSTHRFASLESPSERHDLSYYLANLIALPGSGEYSVASLLRPGAFARSPLLDRVHALPDTMGVVYAYGEKDWMDADGGKDAVKAMRRAGNRRGAVFICPEAGHHLYMDNPEAVNQMLWDRLAPPEGIEGFPAANKTPASSRRNSVSALGVLGAPSSPTKVNIVQAH